MSVWKYILTFRWANITSQFAGYLSGVALLAATFATVHGVASRYFFGHPTIWQTELSIYLLMFVTFVGGAYGLRHHAHVGVDLLIESLPTRTQIVMRLLSAVLSLAVVVVVCWTATQMWWQAYQEEWTSSTAWGPPLSLVYAILPLGMLLVACQYVAFVIEAALGLLGRIPSDQISLLKRSAPEGAVQDFSESDPDHGAPGAPGSEPMSRHRSH